MHDIHSAAFVTLRVIVNCSIAHYFSNSCVESVHLHWLLNEKNGKIWPNSAFS